MELQHINCKIYTEAEAGHFDPEQLIDVFHDWIRQGTLPGFLIDVADYRHVPEGPGVMLIAHEAQYNLDEADGRRGLRYNRREVLDGDDLTRLRDALGQALRAVRLLEERFPGEGGLRFSRRQFQISVCDRALAPPTPETFENARPTLESFLEEALGGIEFELVPRDDPRRIFAVEVTAARPLDIDAVISRC